MLDCWGILGILGGVEMGVFIVDKVLDLKKGIFDCCVAGNEHVAGDCYRLGVSFVGAGAAAFGGTVPGQFAQLDLSQASLPAADRVPEHLRSGAERKVLLRRPLSFCDVRVEGERTFVSILYRVVGPATLRMMNLRAGDVLSVIGPLGNGFRVGAEEKKAILVVGGIGAGPMFHLSKYIGEKYGGIERFGIVGARGATEFPVEDIAAMGSGAEKFARDGMDWLVCSDDGSVGRRGLVTERLMELLEGGGFVPGETMIYACGPEGMLAAVGNVAEKYGVGCQVSLEKRMACGIGLCQSCAVECRVEGSKETIYKMCCKDGPVFDSSEVVF